MANCIFCAVVVRPLFDIVKGGYVKAKSGLFINTDHTYGAPPRNVVPLQFSHDEKDFVVQENLKTYYVLKRILKIKDEVLAKILPWSEGDSKIEHWANVCQECGEQVKQCYEKLLEIKKLERGLAKFEAKLTIKIHETAEVEGGGPVWKEIRGSFLKENPVEQPEETNQSTSRVVVDNNHDDGGNVDDVIPQMPTNARSKTCETKENTASKKDTAPESSRKNTKDIKSTVNHKSSMTAKKNLNKTSSQTALLSESVAPTPTSFTVQESSFHPPPLVHNHDKDLQVKNLPNLSSSELGALPPLKATNKGITFNVLEDPPNYKDSDDFHEFLNLPNDESDSEMEEEEPQNHRSEKEFQIPITGIQKDGELQGNPGNDINSSNGQPGELELSPPEICATVETPPDQAQSSPSCLTQVHCQLVESVSLPSEQPVDYVLMDEVVVVNTGSQDLGVKAGEDGDQLVSGTLNHPQELLAHVDLILDVEEGQMVGLALVQEESNVIVDSELMAVAEEDLLVNHGYKENIELKSQMSPPEICATVEQSVPSPSEQPVDPMFAQGYTDIIGSSVPSPLSPDQNTDPNDRSPKRRQAPKQTRRLMIPKPPTKRSTSNQNIFVLANAVGQQKRGIYPYHHALQLLGKNKPVVLRSKINPVTCSNPGSLGKTSIPIVQLESDESDNETLPEDDSDLLGERAEKFPTLDRIVLVDNKDDKNKPPPVNSSCVTEAVTETRVVATSLGEKETKANLAPEDKDVAQASFRQNSTSSKDIQDIVNVANSKNQQEGQLKCDKCHAIHFNRDEMVRYQNAHENEDQEDICEKCGWMVANLDEHIAEMHPQGQEQSSEQSCPTDILSSHEDQAVSDVVDEGPSHLKPEGANSNPDYTISVGENSYRYYHCTKCPFVNSAFTCVKNHLLLHKPNAKYDICKICKWFIAPKLMKFHMTRRHQSPPAADENNKDNDNLEESQDQDNDAQSSITTAHPECVTNERNIFDDDRPAKTTRKERNDNVKKWLRKHQDQWHPENDDEPSSSTNAPAPIPPKRKRGLPSQKHLKKSRTSKRRKM